MSTPYLLITEIYPKENQTLTVAKKWRQITAEKSEQQATVFVSLDNRTVLQLRALSSLKQIESLPGIWELELKLLGEDLVNDFRRQLLTYVESVKVLKQSLPSTPYLQLRHIEVPPSRFTSYRQWRDKTIFDVVRKASEVEEFIAYHSIISTEPGVMFLSGFSVDPEIYKSLFSSPRYQEIIKKAGDNFITGGEGGLYTKIYKRFIN
ncbi:hypothetical protein [Bartonella grahamii]|uniref:hypothetical protein n=1 Tax=Bartonella grahamii TaxID=33045 RepID=UPI002E7C1E93|nr:hypothetical protein [Bartonella grahamii]